jgi:hypothetical protein
MKSSTALRITSLITLIFAAGHFLGGMESWSPVGETEVLKAMKSFRFDAEGVTRTYFDFYLGFGFILSVYLFLQAVLLWQLAALAKTEALRLRPLIVSFFIASVVAAGLSWKFIFAVPAVSFVVIAVGLGFAFFAASRDKDAQPPVPADGPQAARR